MRVRTVRRRELQHVILEVGERFALTEVFVIGSSAILAVLPDPPEGVLTATRDVEYGYHAQGVSLRTPTYAPHGWQTRTIDVSVGKIVAHCMAPHDLVLSKLAAGRGKDLEFASAAAAMGLVVQSLLLTHLRLVPSTKEHLRLIAERISALFK